jgi:TetR/AcrR family transcriptional regulator, mexJK operon transcriptional repressor
MRTWPKDHPKARLLKRKRDAILSAARRQFLASGYDATSMETIAADAGVSIMTLYRHARSKDELFEAVVKIECDAEHGEAAVEDFLSHPLTEALSTVAEQLIKEVLAPDRIAVLRAVIAETGRFPHLGEMAYRAIVDDAVAVITRVVRAIPELATDDALLERASRTFVDTLLGDKALRLLLGVPLLDGPEPASDRIADAVDTLLSNLGAARGLEGAGTEAKKRRPGPRVGR